MSKVVAITTVDNPFDPIDNVENWYAYDQINNHRSCEMLARFSYCSDSMSDEEYVAEIERAIDEIVNNDPTGLYLKVVRNVNDENERINYSH